MPPPDSAPRCPRCGWRLIPEDGPSGVCLPCQARAAGELRAQAEAPAVDAPTTTAQRRTAQGLCVQCATPLTTGRRRCAACLAQQRTVWHARKTGEGGEGEGLA